MKRLQELKEELEETLDRRVFEKFDTPEALHYLAQNWSWETEEGVQVIRWICESRNCSKATALLIFWLAQPQDYTAYRFGSKVPFDNGVFAIVQMIIRRYTGNEYQHYGIHYDPAAAMPDEDITIDDRFKAAVEGEETWYDEDYIKSLYWYVPSELKGEIFRCGNIDYLQMFADGLNEFKSPEYVAELVMHHPLCDKGIALLLYWRLLLHYYTVCFTPPKAMMTFNVLQELGDKIVAGALPVKIAYAPLSDEKNKKLLGQEKQAWKIPDIFMSAV